MAAVSTMRNQETEWQGQLLNLHLENIRINARIQFRLQTVRRKRQISSEISHLQSQLLDLRNSVARNQSSDNRDADNLRDLRGKNTLL